MIHWPTQGIKRVVTVDLHAGQSQTAFRNPFDHLTAQILLRNAMMQEAQGYNRGDMVVVAPDVGSSGLAERHRQELGTGVIHLGKVRDAKDSRKIHREDRVPEADGKVCLVFDD